MALIVKTNNPEIFISNFNNRINSHGISSWLIDSDRDITIANPKWRGRAWFHYHSNEGDVIFGIIESKVDPLTRELYGVYHGRLCAMLLSNFDNEINSIIVQPLLDRRYDRFKLR